MSEIMPQVSSSIDALMQEFEVITHNLANVSTVGYKRRCNAFLKSLEAQKTWTETYSPMNIELELAFDFSQGNITETSRPLDFALFGKGFFVIETSKGPLYTRNGVFHRNQNGQIIDSQGRIVAGEAGPITIPSDVVTSQVSVSSDGNIIAGGTTIGKFQLVDFEENEAKLVPTGESCYQMPDDTIQPVTAENIVIRQGYQEVSNVKIIDELVDMIMVSRLYEANMKTLTATAETSSSLMSVAMG